MSAASDRRNERARALGFSSYSQQYRAKQAGYEGRGYDYNVALTASRAPGVTSMRSAGRAVFGAKADDARQLLKEAIGRQRLPSFDKDDLQGRDSYTHQAEQVTIDKRGSRYYVTIETADGEVVRPQAKGGFTKEQLLGMFAESGDEMWDAYLDEMWGELYSG